MIDAKSQAGKETFSFFFAIANGGFCVYLGCIRSKNMRELGSGTFGGDSDASSSYGCFFFFLYQTETIDLSECE